MSQLTDLGVTLLWLTVPMDNTSQSGKGNDPDPHYYTGLPLGGFRSSITVTRWSDGTDTVIVALNRSDSAQNVGGVPSGSFTDLLTGNTVRGGTVNVPARKALILVAQ